MFKIGEFIIYGISGVCLVKDITASPVDKSDTRQYYVLEPQNSPSSSIIYTPIDNDRVKTRAVMTRDEAESFIDSIPSITAYDQGMDKKRRDVYYAAMLLTDPVEYVKIIKTVAKKRSELKYSKKLSDVDVEYEKRAKLCLFGELSKALDIPYDNIEEYIKTRTNQPSEATV